MPSRLKRRLSKYLFLVKPTLLLGLAVLFLVIFIRIFFPLYSFTRDNNISFSFLISLLFNNTPDLKSHSGRTNIVILGISGGEHEGFDLTDTIIFLSVDFKKKDGLMLSIPRDLYLNSLKDKINTAFHYGEKKKEGGGLVLTKSTIEEVVGIPVHFGWVIDFSGFKDIIDIIGGVNIYVEREFTDQKYPIEGRENDFCGGDPTFACRFETIHFNSGWQLMDGERALKYVRSRNAEGEEGTDFARIKRQQQIIMALKDELLTLSILRDREKIKNLIDAFDKATLTDMNWSEKLLFFRFFVKIPEGNLRRITFDSGDKEKERPGFLENPPLWQYDGIWVLVPRTGNFEEIHEYISCHLSDPQCSIKP